MSRKIKFRAWSEEDGDYRTEVMYLTKMSLETCMWITFVVFVVFLVVFCWYIDSIRPEYYVYKTYSGNVGVAKSCCEDKYGPIRCISINDGIVQPESYRAATEEEIRIIKDMYGGEKNE